MPAAFVHSEVAAGCVRFCTEEANAQAAVLAQAVVYAGIADAAVAGPRIPLSYRTMRRGARSMVASRSGQRDQMQCWVQTKERACSKWWFVKEVRK